MAKNVKVGISVDTNKGVVSVNKLNQSFVNLNQKTKDTKESFLGLSKAILDMNAHFVQSYHGYKAMFDSVSNYAKSFIELNAQYEKTKKNIASLIAVNSSNVTSFGKTLNIQEKYQLSLKQSAKTLEQFNNLSAKSGYAVSDLADIFSSFYAGASKNMNFDESIKSFENLMQTLKISGLGVEQLKMTIDGLGDGAVLSSSDLGRFLKQIGLTNEAIKEANASGNLYNLIIQKTSENVKVAQLALGGYEDNVRLLKSNIDKLKRELSKPIFESVNESLLKLNIYMEENKDSISSFIKTFQSLTPILINVSLAFASLKAYSKIAPILSKGFLELKASILDTKNALYLQRVGLLSNTQSINEINKRTIVLSRGFKALSNVAKNAIPLVLIERLFAIEDALDKAYEKTEKLNSSFKRKIEILDIEDLKKQKEQLEKELESISDIGSFQNTIGNFLKEYSFEIIGDDYKKAISYLQKIDFSFMGAIREQSVEDAREIANIAQKIAFLDDKIKQNAKEEVKLKSVEKLNKELKDAVELITKIQIPKIESQELEKTNKALDDLNKKLLELVSINNWEQNSALVEQVNIISNALDHAAKADEIKKILDQEEKAKLAQEKHTQIIKEQNQALKELSQITMSEYEKSLESINEKLKHFKEIGFDGKTIQKAKEEMIIDLDLKESQKEFQSYKSLMLEFYESVGKKQEAWALKEIELREKFIDILDKEDLQKLIKTQKEAFLNVEKNASKTFKNVENDYLKMIANMQRTIESRFFDFIEGKIKNLKELFIGLGKSLAMDMLSPAISSISGSISGIFTNSLMGANNSYQNISLISQDLGLKKDNNGNFTGVIDGKEVIISSNGEVKKGQDVLNGVSNVLSGFNALEGILSGSTFEKIQSFSSFNFSSIGDSFTSVFQNFSNLIKNIGTLGSNILSLGSAYLGGFFGGTALTSFSSGALWSSLGIGGINGALAGGIGSTLGFVGGLATNALSGGLLGYGIGKLGDMLFKADTHAGSGGAIGGVLGSLIAPGIGTLVGGLLGSVIGGIFGKTKATGSGLRLWQDINFKDHFSQGNLQSYIDYQKKGWFSKKSWTEYQNINDRKIKELNLFLDNQYALLEKLGANLDKYEINAGKYSGNSLVDTAVPNALLKSFLNTNDNELINEQIKAIQQAAKESNISYAEQLSKQFGQFMSMQSNILSQIYKHDPVKVAKITLDDTMYALKTAIRNVSGGFDILGLKEDEFKNLSQISLDKLNDAYNESLRNDFSTQNVEAWEQLLQALASANEQVNNILQTIINKTSELMQINQSFAGVNGLDTSVFKVNDLLNQYATIMGGLKDDLNKEEQDIFKDIFSANDKLLELGYEGVNDFLSTGNTELRKQLIAIITSFEQIMKEQGGLIFSSEHLNELAKVDELIKAYEDDSSKEYAKIKINENNKLLENLNNQKNILSSLASFSDNLIKQTIQTPQMISKNYEKLLKKASDDFKNNNFNSSSFEELKQAASAKANDLRNSSSYEEYQFQMLKMANDMKDLGGEADLNTIQDEIAKITLENEKLNEKLQETIKDTSSMTLEELKKYRETLLEQSQKEVQEMIKYLGKDSPIAKYLEGMIKELKNGSSLSVAAIENLKYALLAYQNNSNKVDSELNQEIKNPNKKPLAFADGGIVTQKTNAIIGENGYPEAVIPLKDGKGLKVDVSNMFEKLELALSKGIDNGFKQLNSKFDGLITKIDNVDKGIKRLCMDMSILTKQTREIAERIEK
ncbi:hypothetical protein FT848_07895 [Campylobacter lari]|uniref:hypothetical protein n=1 Tax=Campylobacter lari TaxID=201 RepID=UPI001276AF9C|nr:hypothetical protein [Campylobacter lari]EAI4303638.1 hypothetical protein [Campylobacter lari]EAK0815882.1 hypothetical protein [Campylobacter lari]EAK5652143.1 hypothetical protein [Campylobacter lari]ECP5248565.1 hypothetical protein [Campylobacter lari]ECP5265358.1 hypothetical protein [Campylobacter lari]